MRNFGLYKMIIVQELKQLKQNLLNKSSPKEQASYLFLIEEPLNYPTENALSEIEQICLSAFCAGISLNTNLTNLIEAQRRKQPIGGMHYTENIIELSAMATYDVEPERKNLISHCENHSTRNFYILNHLFPNISSNPPPPQGPIDEIALYLYGRNFPQEGWKPLLLKALQETSDLMDFYVIEQGYLQAMDDNPIIHKVNDIIYVRNAFVCFVEKTERRVKRNIGIVSGILVIIIIGWVVHFIVTNWDKAEPTIAATEICIRLILALIIGIMGFTPSKIKIFNLFREKIIDWVFSRKGFNRSELRESLNRLDPNNITQ